MFNQARELFAGLRDKIFLDAACVSLIPDTSKEEINKMPLVLAAFVCLRIFSITKKI